SLRGTIPRRKYASTFKGPNSGTFRRSREFLFQVELPDRLAYGEKPAKTRPWKINTGGTRANTTMKMVILARPCRPSNNDISSSFQPIWTKQETSVSSREGEYC
ncbi:hypothetical protein G9A89_000568, partial [Geosiphon pyriformis]